MNVKQITYINCNLHTIVLFLIFIPSLVITYLMVILLISYEYDNLHPNANGNVCNPMYFFLGNNINCKRFVENTLDADTFKNYNSSQDSSPNIISNNVTFTEMLKLNYLAIIEFIYSFKDLFILSVFRTICYFIPFNHIFSLGLHLSQTGV
jgi:hypothetical protein